MNYQTGLIQIQNNLFSRSDGHVETKLFEEFQEQYPGNYKLEWKFSHNTMKFELYPIFENSNEETMWKLKYG